MQFPINFRAFIIVALSVVLSVFSAYAYMFNRSLGIVFGCLIIAFLAALTVISILKYKYKGIRFRFCVTFSLSLILGACAFGGAISSYENWHGEFESDVYCAVSGRVCAVDIRSGNYRLNLEELTINGKPADGIMRVSISASDQNTAELIECGDRLHFGVTVKAVKLFEEGKVNGQAYRTNIRYTATVHAESLIIDFGKPTALESFNASLHKLYIENMGDKYGNIAFSMITGDKHALDSDITDYFNAAGLGHIMAVSGLHIGFLVLVLNFILMKVRKSVRFPIIAMILLGYTVLADFSPSVIRAVVMTVISGIGVLIGGRRDLLSSLLCAFSLILAVKPLYLFEAGFLLSFGAIFGIAMFSVSITRMLVKAKTNRKVANSIGASVSVSAGILPAQIYFFGKISLFAIIVNSVLLPYISVVFISIVCLTPFAAIPHCGVILSLCKYLMMPLDYIAYGIASVPHSLVSLKQSAVAFLCFPIMFCASDFFMMRKGKTAVVLYSAAVCVLFCFIGAV
ncbi:MAG: ComEC/Rec2 family competence protein [Clostridiales bacterium]|nr:ComEC/Rec2 family competence protein [Clostridiales bacterium]